MPLMSLDVICFIMETALVTLVEDTRHVMHCTCNSFSIKLNLIYVTCE